MAREKVIILGAAGMDFHTFNTCFRNNENYKIVCFTATQIPDIEGRTYPKELAGKLYPNGIPIYPEEDLPKLIKEHNIDTVVLAYSDLSHETVMHKASIVLANGAAFKLMGPKELMLKSKKPVIAICAVRTGVGKSQTTRKVAEFFKEKGYKLVVVRHPMPYGDLTKQICQRFATYNDLDKYETTIEEREEYEPHIDRGNILYAGVDYKKILDEAEKEADIILWDGGNNDIAFYKPDLYIVLADAKRPGHEMKYHPGETNFRRADVIIINKIADANPEAVKMIKKHAQEANPSAQIIEASSLITTTDPEKIRGKRVLVVEDGPSTTHGDLNTGAATVVALREGVKERIDPKPFAVGSIKSTFEKYPHLDRILPAMGYGEKQISELEKTINAIDCDVVLVGTPIDLTRILKVNKPLQRVKYDYAEINDTDKLGKILEAFTKKIK
ncbi:MAG: cyclic 2,3-diphosphoglycerate synthase [Candidatus Hodarchaeota archaeon]